MAAIFNGYYNQGRYVPSNPSIEEAAWFRAMSPQEQMQSIRKVLEDGARALRQSPIADFLRGYRTENNEIDRRAFKRFIAQELEREKQT